MPYFDTVTGRSVLSRWPLPPSEHINKAATLPAASSWSTDQLRAARLVVRSATSRSEREPDHVLPDLREHFGEAETVCSQPLIRGLLEGPSEASLDRHTNRDRACPPVRRKARVLLGRPCLVR